MFRYQDENNYYRFTWDKERSTRKLVKCEDGVFSILAEDSVPYRERTSPSRMRKNRKATRTEINSRISSNRPRTETNNRSRSNHRTRPNPKSNPMKASPRNPRNNPKANSKRTNPTNPNPHRKRRSNRTPKPDTPPPKPARSCAAIPAKTWTSAP